MKRLLYLLVFVGLCGCSDTINDKERCFYAIFREAPKPVITVYQRKLWENRHLFVFYEFYAIAEFDASEADLMSLMKNANEEFEPFDATNYGFDLKPDEHWFAPRDGSKYLGWRSKEGMYVIRSSKTKRVYAMRVEL